MKDSTRLDGPPLLFGPYFPPDISDGWLVDWIDGSVEVGSWTDAPLPWPRRKREGRSSVILCDGLIREVMMESRAAVQYHWGVSGGTVWKWRRALGVGRITPGTRERLRSETGVPPEAAARGRLTAYLNSKRPRLGATEAGCFDEGRTGIADAGQATTADFLICRNPADQ